MVKRWMYSPLSPAALGTKHTRGLGLVVSDRM